MALESNWANTSDVVRDSYGERNVDQSAGGGGRRAGVVEEVVIEFSYDDLPGASQGELGKKVPANSFIVEARWETVTAFAGGTSYDVGLIEDDGTAINADGLWDALVLADIDAVGEWSMASSHGGTDSGALTGVHIPTTATEPAQLVVAATGTFTAGKARVIIEYIPPTS